MRIFIRTILNGSFSFDFFSDCALEITNDNSVSVLTAGSIFDL